MILTGEQIQAARVLVRMKQPELAEASGLSVDTVKRLEGTRGPISANTKTAAAVRQALEAAGAIFIDENGEGPGVRLRKRNASNARAS